VDLLEERRRAMKRNAVIGALVGIFLVVGSAQATVLDFDDLADQTILGNYGGLTWGSQEWRVMDLDLYAPGTGYQNGVVSEDNIVYNRYGNFGTVSDGTFNFDGAYLTAAWNDGLNIEVNGYLNNVLQYSQIVVVDTTGPTWFQADYTGVDSLTFDSFGGVNVGLGGEGTQFAMDNFTFNEGQKEYIPEPATMSLLGIGLVGMAARKLRRRK